MVQIASIIDIAKMVGVSRLLRGSSLCSPMSDYSLDAENEKTMRRKYVEKALEMMKRPGQKNHFETI